MVSIAAGPRGRAARRWTTIALGAALLAAGLAVEALRSGGGGAVIAGAVLVLLAGSPLLLRLRTERLDAPGLYGAVTVVMFGVTSLAWVGGQAPTPGPSLDRAAIAHAEVLVAAGLAAFALGALLAAGRARPAVPTLGTAKGPAWQIAAAAYCACAGAVVLGLATRTYGYLNTGRGGSFAGALSFVGGQASVVILVTAVAYLRDPDPRLRRVLIAMLAVQVPLGFVAGVKGESLIALLLLLLAAIAYREPIPWRKLSVAVLLLVFVLLPANTAYRQDVRAQGLSVVASIKALIDPALYRPDHALSAAGTYVFARFRDIDHVALIERDTPSLYAYGDGSTYALLPLIVAVPRALWDGKPVLDAAAQFSRTYWQIPPSIHTSQPLTQVGDLYRNFAWPGVLVGMLMWGGAIGLWERLRRARPSPRMIVVYLWSLVTAVTYVEGDLPNLVATTARALPITYFTAWLLLPGSESHPGYRRLLDVLRRAAGVRKPRLD